MPVPTSVQQVCLVLSPRAAESLAAYIERGGAPKLCDIIAGECRNQLATPPSPDEQLDVGAIAKRMAEAAVAAVKAA